MIQMICKEFKTLTVFRGLFSGEVGQSLTALLDKLDRGGDGPSAVEDYGRLFHALAQAGYDCLGVWLLDALRYEETPYARAAAHGRESAVLEGAARHDVAVLSRLACLPCGALKMRLAELCGEGWRKLVEELPEWGGGEPLCFDDLKRFYRANGTGIFARYRAFKWTRGELLPVKQPDFVPEEQLWGYRLQREKVVANTRSLVEGRQVNNVLLFGEPGTGKSATVKALLGMKGFEALRLVEINKNDLGDMGRLLRILGQRPQKFILFIDDLSFDQEDMTYSVLKSLLEGGLEPRPDNVAVYATSNRRNLVRQNFSDRSGDEVDVGETIQEKTSLAERFGLRIPYTGLNRMQFLQMVEELAALRGLEIPRDTLRAEAIKWEMRHPSRTPRTAVQFLASLHIS